MCIVFISSVQHMSGGYRLIVASNRDEYYDRATLSADYWSEDRDVIGGRDLVPSSKGGTWLALNVRGKLAILLNVVQRDKNPNAKSRGRLVEDFVKSNTPAPDYMRGLQDVYNGFKLITITMSESFLETHFITNCSVDGEDVNVEHSLPNGVRGFSNASFLKVTEGERRFKDIVKKYGHRRTKDTLIEEILSLLKWDKQHYPDEEIIKWTPKHSNNDSKGYSSIFVEMAAIHYGTRTHTIILVDHDGKIEYNEWTMSNSNWEQRSFTTALKICKQEY